MPVTKLKQTLKCSICRKPIDVQPHGWAGGHNAAPITDGRCCTNCNTVYVIPARLKRLLLDQESD